MVCGLILSKSMEMIMRIMNGKERSNAINSIERYELFEEALSHCGTFLLDLSDEDIEYHVGLKNCQIIGIKNKGLSDAILAQTNEFEFIKEVNRS